MILVENALRKLVGKNRTVVVQTELIRIQDGDLALLIGPNGFGKTTLLRLIGGSVSLNGGKVKADRPLFCITDIENQVDPKLTPLENFHYLCAYFDHDVPTRDASLAALERCGAAALVATVVGKLSKGQKTRVILAFLLATNFKTILLDEPGNGLDYEGEQLMLTVMEEKRLAGAAIVLATHSPEKMLEKATTLIVKNIDDKFEQIEPKKARFTRGVIVRLDDGTSHHVALAELKDFLIVHDHELLDIITERTVALS